MYRVSSNKYNARKTEYNGVRYDSKLEASVAYELDMRLKAGDFVSVERQHKIKLYVYLPDGSRAYLFNYIVDFKCERPDGSVLLVEAKGLETEVFKVKKKILDLVWLPDNPGYEYEIIKSMRGMR